MREEEKAEEPKITQERDQHEDRMEPLAVLQKPMRKLSCLPPAATLGPQTTVRDAIEVMRQQQLSAVLVVEDDELVGVFTERDVIAKVAVTSFDVDRVRLHEVMQPEPESLQLDTGILGEA